MKNFRTYNVAMEFYNKAKDLKLKGVLQNQYDRALLSIVLNLAEGSAKPTARDRKKYYYTSFGSFREVQSLLQLSNNIQLLTDSGSLGAHLYKLCKNTG